MSDFFKMSTEKTPRMESIKATRNQDLGSGIVGSSSFKSLFSKKGSDQMTQDNIENNLVSVSPIKLDIARNQSLKPKPKKLDRPVSEYSKPANSQNQAAKAQPAKKTGADISTKPEQQPEVSKPAIKKGSQDSTIFGRHSITKLGSYVSKGTEDEEVSVDSKGQPRKNGRDSVEKGKYLF
jgi:hypothetical protein